MYVHIYLLFTSTGLDISINVCYQPLTCYMPLFQFNWSGVISQLFKTAGVQIYENQSIVISNPTYLRNLSDLIRKTDHK